MKNFKDILHKKLLVTEKLIINKNIKIKRNLDNWTIETAQDGDIVELDDTLLFIYKGLNKDIHVNNAGDDAIVYHATYICDERKKLEVGIDTGVGVITGRSNRYKLASEEKCDEFMEALKKAGYKWDDNKLKIVKI